MDTKHTKTFPIFESAQELTSEQKEFLDLCAQGTWSLNPLTGLVDVNGDFNCGSCRLHNFKGVRFGNIDGEFSCRENLLVTLNGAPQTVKGHFWCSGNFLETLDGAPREVGGDFYADANLLVTLEGAPLEIGRHFLCNDNWLKTLKGAPKVVGGDFRCNSNLQSLEGAPQTIKGQFTTKNLTIRKGGWSMDTLIGIFINGTHNEKNLIESLVDPKKIQRQIDENPEDMLINLKGHLKHPHLQGLKWPQNLDREKDLISDLGDFGL